MDICQPIYDCYGQFYNVLTYATNKERIPSELP